MDLAVFCSGGSPKTAHLLILVDLPVVYIGTFANSIKGSIDLDELYYLAK